MPKCDIAAARGEERRKQSPMKVRDIPKVIGDVELPKKAQLEKLWARAVEEMLDLAVAVILAAALYGVAWIVWPII